MDPSYLPSSVGVQPTGPFGQLAGVIEPKGIKDLFKDLDILTGSNADFANRAARNAGWMVEQLMKEGLQDTKRQLHLEGCWHIQVTKGVVYMFRPDGRVWSSQGGGELLQDDFAIKESFKPKTGG